MIANDKVLLLSDAEFLFAHTECKILNLTNWHSVYYKILPKDKSLFGGQIGDCISVKKLIKSAKAHFFRFFSIFAFRCMVKWPLIGGEIAPVIAVKFSGLV